MAKITQYGYVPEPQDIHDGKYTPDSKVSGRRFEPDGNGGGTLFIRKMVLRAGFRKPVETWIRIRKQPYSFPATEIR